MLWKKVSPKAGQTFMVIGAAGELPKPPVKPVVFLEGYSAVAREIFKANKPSLDMDDTELAEAVISSTLSFYIVLILSLAC